MNSARWKAYLSMEYKAESQGKGNDDTNPVALECYVDFFKKYIPVEGFYSVFDPGAGAGASVKMLKNAGYSVVGYTLGKDNVQMAKDKYGVTLIEHDMHTPAFNDNSFDAIFAQHICEHAISFHILLIEFYRILRVGGRMMFCVPDPEDAATWCFQWHHSLMSANYYLKYLIGYGFNPIFIHNEGRDMILEKVPPEKHPTWEYFKWIYENLKQVTNSD